MEGSTVYLIAHGAVTVLVLQRLMVIERRMGMGDFILDRLKRYCPHFNGNRKDKEEDPLCGKL